MPFKVVKDADKCSVSKPWAVISEGSGDVKGCHATKESADKQRKALYANYKGSDMSFYYGIDLSGVKFDEDDRSWVHAMAPGNYNHKLYGTISLTYERIQRFANNIKNKVRGIDPDIDYDHKKTDGRAAGWVRDARVESNGLWLLVEWTKNAAQAIREGEYKYISPEFTNEWEHPETGETYEDILVGGALTNRPFLKNLQPINLSELEEEGMDPQLREALIKRFGLSEDVSDEDLLVAVQDEESEEADKLDLSSAEVTVSDDGAIIVTHPEADGEVTIEPPEPSESSTSEELASLAEDYPEVQQLIERVGTLETSNKLSEVTMQLNELNTVNPKVALPPVAIDKFKSIMVKAPKQLSEDVYEALTDLVKTGLVQLGEESGGEDREFEGGDEVKRFTEAVEKARSEHEGMKFSEAVELIAAEQPELYRSYHEALERAAK